MIRHQTNAMPIQMTSCLPIGVFHQIRSDGGKNELILYSPIYSGRDRNGGDFHHTPEHVKNRRHCDTDKQQQNVADLSRDAEHANNALSPIFDKEKEQNRLREINLIGEIGNQVGDIARTHGKIAEEKALKDPQAIQAAKEALAAKGNLTPTEKQLTEQIRNTAMATYGTGSDLQRAIQAATAVTQGLTGGNLGQALAHRIWRTKSVNICPPIRTRLRT